MNPADLFESGEVGTPSVAKWWWPRPWWPPNELPAFHQRINPVVEELVKLRGRVHALENELTVAKFSGRFGGIGGPAEMPPPELPAELGPGELPPPQELPEAEIAELQAAIPEFVQRAFVDIVDQRIAATMERLLDEVSGLRNEVKQLSKGKR